MNDEIPMTKHETKTLRNALFARAFALVSSFEFRHSNSARMLVCAQLLLTSGGCIFYHTDPSAKLVTAVDPVQATQEYWWNQPTKDHASCRDFDKLWNACKGELYVRLFPLDREQYREGLISSEAVVSAQFFEPWRRDTASIGDLVESSLSSIRRTVRIEVSRKPDGSYVASPKVLVERWAAAERRLTSITQYHEAFGGSRVFSDTTDQSGQLLGGVYWYPVRRDLNLEKAMAESIQRAVGKTGG
jgi:hypothetical protein